MRNKKGATMSGAKSLFAKSSEKPSPPHEEISAFLGKETAFEGKITFEGVFRLEGKFEGEIFEGGTLIVGETGTVKGKVGANTVIVNGLVEGEIHAKARMEIHSAGKVYGDIFTPLLAINEGGILEGHCKMEGILEQKGDLHIISREVDHPLSA
jgi:cytoskeletal protein CcmA (bactofilin family)